MQQERLKRTSNTWVEYCLSTLVVTSRTYMAGAAACWVSINKVKLENGRTIVRR